MSNPRSRTVSVVALLADIPSTGYLGSAQAQRFTVNQGDLAAQSGDFLDFADHHLSNGRKVVALYPQWRAEPATRAIRFARGSFRSDHIAAVPLDLSPLAFSLLADQLAYLAPYLPPGMVASLASELNRHVLAGGWLRRVSNLSTIPTSIRQHVGSYLPGTTFLGFCAPTHRVGLVRKNDPRANIRGRPVDPVHLLVSHPQGLDTKMFHSQFIQALRPAQLDTQPEQPLASTYWGTRRYLEFIAFSAHPEALTTIVRSVRPSTCAWCHEPVADIRCRFCGAVKPPPAGRPPARQEDVPPPPTTSGEHARPAWVQAHTRASPPQSPPFGTQPPQGASQPTTAHPGEGRAPAESQPERGR